MVYVNGLKRVRFSNDTKNHDGVILEYNNWVYYHVVCGFLGIKTIFGEIVTPIKSVQDIVNTANSDSNLLEECLEKVLDIKDLLKALEMEEYISQELQNIKNYINNDAFNQVVCGNAICLDKFCCIQHKLSRKRKGIALVRNGCRGSNVALSVQTLPKIRKLVHALHKAIEEAKFNLNIDWDYIKAPENKIEDDYIIIDDDL